ncbi:AAA family ATPase [Bradyrhizobium sp. BRP19]|uniref:AAA family ATPase n=1 Tax=Bradyrhizobium sp. BRP19 TaxID=2793823 RepID=UPI001CD38CBC|nr:AAA family ATPase [Bradyrhizobium sp. BRP19]MCA1546448.1 AAA family ATPase [Bradyrhizobium sp. BRP19]
MLSRPHEVVAEAFAAIGIGAERPEPPPHTEIPEQFDDARREVDHGAPGAVVVSPFAPITPAVWEGVEIVPQRWVAHARIPCGDVTILSGNGGSGKTEIATQLLVSVAAGLGDWLGCVTESGPALFLSCEEQVDNLRDRIERICRHRSINPYGLDRLYLLFPDLDETWLGTADRAGKITPTALMLGLQKWVAEHKPRLVIIDNVAAVFDGEAIARRQVRTFIGMLRKVAAEHDVGILLLDHPSVRGMADGSGTAGSVDWRNSVRSMMYLSDPDKEDQDQRTLEVKKTNRVRGGEKVTLRWSGLTFTTAMAGETSPYRAAADREVDDVFLRLLDRFAAQGRTVRPAMGRGSAPAEMADEPDACGIKAEAFRAAMARLLTAGTIRIVESGPPSRRSKHLERAAS